MNEEQRHGIVAACERLALDFAWHVDHRNAEDVVALFAPEASFERKGEVLKGRAEIRAAQLKRPAGLVTRHVCANLRIDVLDADHARGTHYFLLYRHDHAAAGSDAEKPAPLGQPETLGEYHDEFVRTAEGWKIARRVAKAAFRRVIP
ncbi:MAG: nuclear transport factor 2 family protein [Burkholderiales bacterium]